MGRRVEPKELICAHCGKPYYRTEAQLRSRPSRFCSLECKYAGRRVGKMVRCPNCGHKFHRKASDLTKQSGGYCSAACYHEHRKKSATSYPKKGAQHIHRIVAEKKLGRPLRPDEIVHHIDGNKLNFDESNIEILPNQAAHTKGHFTGKRQQAGHVAKRMASQKAGRLRSLGLIDYPKPGHVVATDLLFPEGLR